MPTLNEHLHKLQSAKCFTVIDVKDGFFHIPLDKKSSDMTTMHTTYGRYRWLRFPFGIYSAPEEFKMRLMTALEGLEGIATIAYDILVYECGDTYETVEADHDKNLSPYYQNLSTTIRPLTELTKKDMLFDWSPTHQAAFEKAKSIVASTPILRYFDPKKPVILQVDASEKGLGGTLLQQNEEQKLQPVAFTSCTPTDTEKRYSQIEIECLAICNAFSKFHHWLYGHYDIVVHTDHKPLEIIVKKPLNRAPARLQRMLLKLQRYQFKVNYKKGHNYT